MSARHQITSIGTATLDSMFYTDAGKVLNTPRNLRSEALLAFEKGAKISGLTACTYGGGGANASVTFAQLGLSPRIITAVGGDAIGSDCIAHLRECGVATNRVQRIEGLPTATSFIVNIVRTRCHVAFVSRGAMARIDLSPQVLAYVTTPWVYVTALTGPWQKQLKNIFQRVRKRNLHIAWNPGDEQVRAGVTRLSPFLRLTDVLLVNQDEAIELLLNAGRRVSRPQPSLLARALHRFGPRMVIVTCGHKGAYLFDGTNIHFQPAKIVRTLNKTGAGDAFGSGFVAGFIMFNSVARALKLAMHNSASVVAHLGAQTGILRREHLKKLRI